MGQILSTNLSSSGGSGNARNSEAGSGTSVEGSPDQPLRPQDRARAAIIGAFVADAVSVSSLFTETNDNDDDKVISNFEKQEGIGISPISSTAQVSDRPDGCQSLYGDEAFPFLRLISTRGYFEPIDAREEAFAFLKDCQEKDKNFPAVHPLMKQFMDKRIDGLRWDECASQDNIQFVAIAKVPILVARYAGSPYLLEKVEDAVKIYQSHPKVIAACRLSARLLERVVLGHTVAETLQWAIALSLASKTTTSSIPCPREGRRGSKVGQITIRGTDSKSVDSAYGFNEDEREFLTSILPAPVAAIPYQSYGSCVSGSNRGGGIGSGTGSGSGIGSGRYQKDDIGSELSDRPASCSEIGEPKNNNCASVYAMAVSSSGADVQCNTAAGAFNYYLGCSPNVNIDRSKSYDGTYTEKVRTQHMSTPHHRRSLSGGPRSCAVPFALAVEEIGSTAQLPDCLQASLYGLLIFRCYKTAVRANIMTRGDNVCRSWLIGAMLAAEQGEDAIPKEWLEQTLLIGQIATMAHRLAGSNPYFETLKEKSCKLSVLLS